MKVLMKTTLILSLIVSVGSPMQAQDTTVQLPQEARDFALQWLLLTCGTEEAEPGLVTELMEWGPRLEPFFLAELERGPGEELVSEVAQAAAERYQARQKLLESETEIGLTDEELERAANVGRDEFVERAKSDFAERYRSQAVAALGYVGTELAQKELARLAADEASPLQSSAQMALEKVEQRPPG